MNHGLALRGTFGLGSVCQFPVRSGLETTLSASERAAASVAEWDETWLAKVR